MPLDGFNTEIRGVLPYLVSFYATATTPCCMDLTHVVTTQKALYFDKWTACHLSWSCGSESSRVRLVEAMLRLPTLQDSAASCMSRRAQSREDWGLQKARVSSKVLASLLWDLCCCSFVCVLVCHLEWTRRKVLPQCVARCVTEDRMNVQYPKLPVIRHTMEYPHLGLIHLGLIHGRHASQHMGLVATSPITHTQWRTLLRRVTNHR